MFYDMNVVQIEWTPEKADILWKVIEIQRTRAVDSAGADCKSAVIIMEFAVFILFPSTGKGLASHLEVPLPYLLYRVNARFQEEIRGLKDIQGALSPNSPQHQFPSIDTNETKVSIPKLATVLPLDVRARLDSLSNIATSRHKKISTSSSITTLQDVATRRVFEALKRPISPTSSGDEADSSDEEAVKEEEAERVAEEEEALARKLAQLQKMMTNEKLGLVNGTVRQRAGRSAPLSTISGGNYRQDALSSASASTSQSISSVSSPHGSIPDIPSPPPERNGNTAGHTPRNRPSNPSSPPRASGRNTLHQQVNTRRRPLVDPGSDLSSHGSEASSFSDISGKFDCFYKVIHSLTSFVRRQHLCICLGGCFHVEFWLKH